MDDRRRSLGDWVNEGNEAADIPPKDFPRPLIPFGEAGLEGLPDLIRRAIAAENGGDPFFVDALDARYDGRPVLYPLSPTSDTILARGQLRTWVDATGGNVTITLPPAAGEENRRYGIALVTNPGDANTLTVQDELAVTVQAWTAEGTSFDFESDGQSWHVV